MFDIETELKKLPDKSGVYIMRDKFDNIIYVGKAISLKRRVKQYFRKNNKTKRIENMVATVDHFEYIVTDNEAEALILECNLIKENRPKFNVLLKDDKTYPYIKIDVKSDYPAVIVTRKILNDGAKYFGPYANPGAAREMINFIIAQIFGLVALIILVISFQKNKKERLLKLQMFSSLLYAIQYVFLKAYTGFFMNIICMIRNLIFNKFKNRRPPLYCLVKPPLKYKRGFLI